MIEFIKQERARCETVLEAMVVEINEMIRGLPVDVKYMTDFSTGRGGEVRYEARLIMRDLMLRDHITGDGTGEYARERGEAEASDNALIIAGAIGVYSGESMLGTPSDVADSVVIKFCQELISAVESGVLFRNLSACITRLTGNIHDMLPYRDMFKDRVSARLAGKDTPAFMKPPRTPDLNEMPVRGDAIHPEMGLIDRLRRVPAQEYERLTMDKLQAVMEKLNARDHERMIAAITSGGGGSPL